MIKTFPFSVYGELEEQSLRSDAAGDDRADCDSRTKSDLWLSQFVTLVVKVKRTNGDKRKMVKMVLLQKQSQMQMVNF